MSTIEERSEFKKNLYLTAKIYGDWSPFYVTISICTVLFIAIVLLNVVIGCCSKHRRYWQDRHTGNRFLVSIWSATPHLQPPLDFTELQDASHYQRARGPQVFEVEAPGLEEVSVHQSHHHHQRPPRPEGHGIHHQRQREEYVELQKRESDI